MQQKNYTVIISICTLIIGFVIGLMVHNKPAAMPMGSMGDMGTMNGMDNQMMPDNGSSGAMMNGTMNDNMNAPTNAQNGTMMHESTGTTTTAPMTPPMKGM